MKFNILFVCCLIQIIQWSIQGKSIINWKSKSNEDDNIHIQLKKTKNECEILMKVSNSYDKTVFISKIASPFDNQVTIDAFDINNGAVYDGILAKFSFSNINIDRLLIIESNSFVKKTINLCDYYNFPSIGKYEVSLSYTMVIVDEELSTIKNPPNEGLNLIQTNIKSNTITISLNKVSKIQHPQFKVENKLSSKIITSGCTSSQARIIDAAATGAKEIAIESLSELPSGSRYQSGLTTNLLYWFGGQFNGMARNDAQMKDVFIKLASYFSPLKIFGATIPKTKYVCGSSTCDSDTYAFVYPSSYGVIYLCPMFWTAPVDKYGVDSQAETLIHEGSHFLKIGGTKDHAYGQGNCRQLVVDGKIDLARNNADNIGYFAATKKISGPTPTKSPTSSSICPTTAPILCNGSNKYCCPGGCCTATNSCSYRGFCCSANYGFCDATDGSVFCCPKTSGCCGDTKTCSTTGYCCPKSAPLLCNHPSSPFCCPPRSNGSTAVCCTSSRSCSSNGFCSQTPKRWDDITSFNEEPVDGEFKKATDLKFN